MGEMPQTIIVHIANEDPIMAEIDELPGAGDSIIMLKTPRRRDGKDIHYLQANVVTLILPINQIAFIEVLSGKDEEKIIGHVRE
jgi:hypothetical protein